MLKIPRISNPNELVDVIYTDKGNIENHKNYVSVFEFEGKKKLQNSFCCKRGDIAMKRYKSDCEFLRKHDLDLEKGIFE